MPTKRVETDQVEDAQLLEWLSRHVCAYSHIGKGRFGFDFNSTREASEAYREDFRKEIREWMKESK